MIFILTIVIKHTTLQAIISTLCYISILIHVHTIYNLYHL